MRLVNLRKKLNRTPIIILNNKESLLCLDESFEIVREDEFCYLLDSPYERLKKDNYILLTYNNKCLRRFPSISIKEPFWSLNFNENLINKYEIAYKLFLKQSEIKDEILKQSKHVDYIVLIIIDGLSYTDCLDWENVRPCLVDTISTTEFGFKNIIGHKKTIANHLFKNGYKKFLGFSYWDKNNELTRLIFGGFPHVNKIQTINKVWEILDTQNLNRSYIQIVTSGLDGLAHKCWDTPLIEQTVNQVKKYIDNFVDKLSKIKLSGMVFVTSDHGILWKHRDPLQKIPFENINNRMSPRYYNGAFPNKEGMKISFAEHNFISLKYPYLTRELRTNEWGVHGGISLQESITPFISLKIN